MKDTYLQQQTFFTNYSLLIVVYTIPVSYTHLHLIRAFREYSTSDDQIKVWYRCRKDVGNLWKAIH